MKIYEVDNYPSTVTDDDYCITSPLDECKSLVLSYKGEDLDNLRDDVTKHTYHKILIPSLNELKDGDFLIKTDEGKCLLYLRKYGTGENG